jgi:hypothetical protein
LLSFALIDVEEKNELKRKIESKKEGSLYNNGRSLLL